MSEIIIDATTFVKIIKLKKDKNKDYYVKIYKKADKDSDLDNQKTNKISCFI